MSRRLYKFFLLCWQRIPIVEINQVLQSQGFIESKYIL